MNINHLNNRLKELWFYVMGKPLVLAVILIGFGLFSLVVGNLGDKRLLESIGMAIFSAGVFSAFFKAMQAAGVFSEVFAEQVEKAGNVFSEQLAQIVFFDASGNYLKNRSDLKNIWQRVTKALHGNAFPKLEAKIAEAIEKTYLPNNYPYYYEDVNVTHTVDLVNSAEQVVKVTTLIEATFVPDQTSDIIEYRSGYSTKAIRGTKQHSWKKLEIGDEKDLLARMKEVEKIDDTSGEYSFRELGRNKKPKKTSAIQGNV